MSLNQKGNIMSDQTGLYIQGFLFGGIGGLFLHVNWLIGIAHKLAGKAFISDKKDIDFRSQAVLPLSILSGAVVGLAITAWVFPDFSLGLITTDKVKVLAFAGGLSGAPLLNLLRKLSNLD